MSKRILAVACFSLVIGVCSAAPKLILADTLKSSSYQFDETIVGGGGLIQSSSNNYQSASSIGDTAIGNSASGNYQIDSGHLTTPDPSLLFSVNSATSFGAFSPSAAQTATSTFTVSNYTSYGYTVQIAGATPTNGPHAIDAMGTDALGGPQASVPGIEQFGINLVANTSPASVGANPSQSIFGVGEAATNYDTPNVYRYVSGETIATAPKSSGVTTFTITYILNVRSLTPGGQYTSNQQLVCIATY
jgi:hypothetical protein